MTAKYLLDLHCGRGELVVALKKCSVVDFDYDIEVAVGSLQWRNELPEALKMLCC